MQSSQRNTDGMVVNYCLKDPSEQLKKKGGGERSHQASQPPSLPGMALSAPLTEILPPATAWHLEPAILLPSVSCSAVLRR